MKQSNFSRVLAAIGGIVIVTSTSMAPTLAKVSLTFTLPKVENKQLLGITTRQIPDETGQPNPGPRNTNPIESQIMGMNSKKALQLELDSVRANYQKWKGDQIAMETQIRLAQIIHLRANQVGVLLQ